MEFFCFCFLCIFRNKIHCIRGATVHWSLHHNINIHSFVNWIRFNFNVLLIYNFRQTVLVCVCSLFVSMCRFICFIFCLNMPWSAFILFGFNIVIYIGMIFFSPFFILLQVHVCIVQKQNRTKFFQTKNEQSSFIIYVFAFYRLQSLWQVT